MTPITKTTEVASVAAEELLRDMAYVLKLTRRVKTEMTADHAPEKVLAARSGEGVLVA